jgi:hypothetical protein
MMVPWVRVCRHAEPRRQRALNARRSSSKGGCATKGLEALAVRIERSRVDFGFNMHLHFSVSNLLALLAFTTGFRVHEAKHSGERM